MEKEEIEALVARIGAAAKDNADLEYDGEADDGFEIARAMLQVLGRKLGLGFVLETQREIIERAELWAADSDRHRRADAVEMAKVAQAGYFLDLIDELAAAGPSGRA